MTTKDEDNGLALITVMILFIMAFAVIFECVLLGIAFFGADEVECNLLWCTFTSTSFDDTIIIESHRTCFYNGYEIDCNNTLPFETIKTDGNFDKKPIFKHDKDWIDILETK